MLYHEELQKQLCSTFCSAIDVRPVPSGFAISSVFKDSSGDPIVCYLSETSDGFCIEDDGSYLSHLVAKDIPIDQGQRAQLLDSILAQSHAYWDRDSYEIKSHTFPKREVTARTIEFLSALLRVRDLELFTREVVKSTFREDATRAICERFNEVAKIEEDAVIAKGFTDFPADLVIRPHSNHARPGAVYFVSSNDKLNEALLLQTEAQVKGRDDFTVIALLEEPEMRPISRRVFQRAQNRELAMPIFRGDEDQAMELIGARLRLKAA